MKVTFNYPDEFLDELRQDGPPDKVMRATVQYSPTGMGPIRSVMVIAGYVNSRGHLVLLRRYVGEHFGKGVKTTDETMVLVKELMGEIDKAATELGLSVRAGRYEDNDK